MAIKIRPLAYALGAEVTGVDGSKPLSNATVKEIREAWLQHQVLVFPDQHIDIAQHISFSKHFGELELHPVMHMRHSIYPEIFEVTNRPVDGKPSETGEIGRMWHSDGAFTVRPPTGSLLHCRARPSVGGDTWFTNMYLAYERLSDPLRQVVDRLEVVNDLMGTDFARGRDPAKITEELKVNPPVIQPMVRTHPETGRKALYLNEAVTRFIYGMTTEESEGLLKYLFKHSVRAEFTYRHVWKLHDIVMWDNRCTMHLAPKDYESSQIRHMCRTTLLGDPTGRDLAGEVPKLVSAA
jgi:taurine dioxygenase